MTELIARPDHLLTTADWEALDENTYRGAELVDGRLVMSPQPGFAHQGAELRLGFALHAAVPVGYRVYPEAELAISDAEYPTYRVPDLIVARAELATARAQRARADQVLLAVEIVSPGSRLSDHVHKKGEYALAGVKHYWIVELDPFRLVTHRLDGDSYVTTVDTTSMPVQLTEPYPVTIEL